MTTVKLQIKFEITAPVTEKSLERMRANRERWLSGDRALAPHIAAVFEKNDPASASDEALMQASLGEDVAYILQSVVVGAYPEGSTIKKVEYSEVTPPLPPPEGAVPQVLALK